MGRCSGVTGGFADAGAARSVTLIVSEDGSALRVAAPYHGERPNGSTLKNELEAIRQCVAAPEKQANSTFAYVH